jgi:2,4-dienoyl-CoA reductase-like NADH-dependent reductase (Old Yellow Enzyme family)
MGCSIYNGDINKNKEFGHQISWFDKIQLGGLQLRNRLVMAPLTRMRSEPKTNAPNKNVVLYYT